MVGDHHNDVAAARGADVRCVFAGWGYGRPGMEDGADVICPAPERLPEAASGLVNA
jgi:phosphoglycolate phosphatase